eukprot:366130-Chlamydomonas_euryale.AAC.40
MGLLRRELTRSKRSGGAGQWHVKRRLMHTPSQPTAVSGGCIWAKRRCEDVFGRSGVARMHVRKSNVGGKCLGKAAMQNISV